MQLDNYFFTRVSTETMAGLPGMLLSSGSGLAAAADAGGLLQGKGGAALPHCTLHGPPGTAGYVAAFKPYINQEQELRVVEAGGAVAGEADASAAPQLLLKTAYLTLSAFNITPSSSHSHPTSADLQPPPLPVHAPEPEGRPKQQQAAGGQQQQGGAGQGATASDMVPPSTPSPAPARPLVAPTSAGDTAQLDSSLTQTQPAQPAAHQASEEDQAGPPIAKRPRLEQSGHKAGAQQSSTEPAPERPGVQTEGPVAGDMDTGLSCPGGGDESLGHLLFTQQGSSAHQGQLGEANANPACHPEQGQQANGEAQGQGQGPQGQRQGQGLQGQGQGHFTHPLSPPPFLPFSSSPAPSSPSVTTLGYVCELAGMPGKFDAGRAEALGVRGPLRGQLQRGQPVSLPCGRLVQPGEVMSPGQPGPVLVVLDVPSLAHLQAVREQKTLGRWLGSQQGQQGQQEQQEQQEQQGQRPLVVVAHLTPPLLVCSPPYKAWMDSLGAGVTHLLCRPGHTSAHQAVTQCRATVLQAKLHAIHPGLFPLLLPASDLPKQQERSEAGQQAARSATGATATTAAGDAAGPMVVDEGSQPAALLSDPMPSLVPLPSSGGAAAAPVSHSTSHSGSTPSAMRDVAGPAAGPSATATATAAGLKSTGAQGRSGEKGSQAKAKARGQPGGSEVKEANAAGKANGAGAKLMAGAGAGAAAAPSLTPLSQYVPGANLLRLHLAPQKQQGVAVGDVPSPDLCLPAVLTEFKAKAGAVLQSAQAVQQAAQALAAVTESVGSGAAAEGEGVAAKQAAAAAGGEGAADMGLKAERPGSVEGEAVPACLVGVGRHEMVVTFLGTGASQPSKYRNVTALYLDCFHRGGLLLDAGEDCLGQMKRRFGAAEAERRVLGLRCVWISHMHADHHGGLYRLLQLRAKLHDQQQQQQQQQQTHPELPSAPGCDLQQPSMEGLTQPNLPGTTQQQQAAWREGPTPLLVIGPLPLFHVLQLYQEATPLAFHFLPNLALLPGFCGRMPPPVVMQAFTQAKEQLGLTELQPFEVVHIRHSCGVRLVSKQGWSMVFSGDSRPCPQTIHAARGVTLLVHEATFEDDMEEDAVRKRHSTTGEALGVADKAGVYRVVLTHFSTRYPCLPKVDLTAQRNMAVALDFMTINLADLPWLPRIVPPLGAFFQQEEDGWEQDEDAAAPPSHK